MKVKYNPTKNIFIPANSDTLLPQIMWHITDKCFLNCKLCFVKKRITMAIEMDNNIILSNLHYLKDLQVQKIDISGGEPLLFNNLEFLVRQAITEGFFLTITTRGFGRKDNIEWLSKNWNMFSRVILSLDSYDHITNDKYVGYNGAFEKFKLFLEKLKINLCNNIRINTVVNRMLLQDDCLAKLCDLIKKISPLEWCIIQPHPLNKSDSYDEYAVSEKEYNLFINKIKSNLIEQKNIDILFRPNSIYSTYWCLYPDNSIARLSSDFDYSFLCKLNSKNMTRIKEVIKSDIQLLPK